MTEQASTALRRLLVAKILRTFIVDTFQDTWARNVPCRTPRTVTVRGKVNSTTSHTGDIQIRPCFYRSAALALKTMQNRSLNHYLVKSQKVVWRFYTACQINLRVTSCSFVRSNESKEVMSSARRWGRQPWGRILATFRCKHSPVLDQLAWHSMTVIDGLTLQSKIPMARLSRDGSL